MLYIECHDEEKKLRLSLFTVQAGPGEPIVFTNPKLIAPPHR